MIICLNIDQGLSWPQKLDELLNFDQKRKYVDNDVADGVLIMS